MKHPAKLFDDLDILRLGKQHFPGASDRQILAFGRSLRGIAMTQLPGLEQQAKDAARLDFITTFGKPWMVQWAKKGNGPIRYRMIDDGEPWGKWHSTARDAIDAAMKEQP